MKVRVEILMKQITKKQKPTRVRADRTRATPLSGAAWEWEKISHGEPTWFVGKKVFAMFSNNHHNDGHVAVVCAPPIGVQQALIEASQKYLQASLCWRAGWIGVELPRVSDKAIGCTSRKRRLIAHRS